MNIPVAWFLDLPSFARATRPRSKQRFRHPVVLLAKPRTSFALLCFISAAGRLVLWVENVDLNELIIFLIKDAAERAGIYRPASLD